MEKVKIIAALLAGAVIGATASSHAQLGALGYIQGTRASGQASRAARQAASTDQKLAALETYLGVQCDSKACIKRIPFKSDAPR